MPNQTATETTQPYNPEAIFDQNSPIHPRCVEQAICTIIRNTPIDPTEPRSQTSRRMFFAMRALAALHPRDEIEVMLGVQALCAYYAATACWNLCANPRLSDSDRTRHISKAATAARTFDTMLRALERRQAKPLNVPIGRPAPKSWPHVDLDAHTKDMRRRCDMTEDPTTKGPTEAESDTMNDDELVSAWAVTGHTMFEDPNQGLDIANTEGILPGGGMIVPEDPTPQQSAYIDRRLMLTYLREQQENHRDGIDKKIVFRPIRTGDLVA
jgi:hypothetical protein